MTNSIRLKKFIYVVSMMFVINVLYSVFYTNNANAFAVAFALFGVLMVGKVDTTLKKAIVAYILPIGVITLISLLTSYFIYETEYRSVYTQSVWRFIQYTVGFVIAYCSVKWFKKDAIKLFVYSGLISYFTVIIKYIKYAGISGLLNPFNNVVNGMSLEVHNLTYYLGLCFLYYLLSQDYSQKEKMKMLILTGIAIVLGNKRTLYLGMAAVLGLYFVFFRFEKKKLRWIKCIFVMLIIFAFLYIWLIKSGQLRLMFEYFGVVDNSRLKFWDYFQDSYEFSFDYWGRGVTYTDYIMALPETMKDMRITKQTLLHNDILRAYIGWGFLPFLFYLCNFFLLRIPLLQRSGGKQKVWKYSVYAIYTFFLWLFDNMFFAIGYNVIFFMVYFLLLEDNKKEEVN